MQQQQRHHETSLAFSEEAMQFLHQVDSLTDEARLTTKQLALLRNCSTKMIEEERVRGVGIPFEKHGRVVRYRLGTVREYLRKMQQRMS